MKKPVFLRRLSSIISYILIDLILNNIIKAISYVMIFIGNLAIAAISFIINILRPIAIIFTNFVTSIHHRLGSIFPFRLRERVDRMIIYAGITRNTEEVLGITLMYSIIVPIVAVVLAISMNVSLNIILIAVILFAAVWLTFYMLLILSIERRTSSIEAVLPDVLAMISQNMIAGMTPYNALWTAARPEFGPLAIEIQKVARDTLAGASLETALSAMPKRVKSEKLIRSIRLMAQGIKSGGELPTVLQEISMDMRAEQNLIKRMRAETSGQAMFIVFALLIGAPLLFAASVQFITIFDKIFTKVDIETLSKHMQGSMISMQKIAITPKFFMDYATITIAISGFFGAFIIGIMRSGKLTAGIPMIPVLISLSVIIFLAFNYLLSSFFGSMITF